MSSNVVPFPTRQRRDETTALARVPGDTLTLNNPPPENVPGTPEHRGQAGQVVSVATAVYTVAEAAHLLSLSLGSTYALVRSGQIPAKKMGGRWVIPKRRFHTWLDDLPEASPEDIERETRRLNRS